jgi:hypothetical protein
LTKIIWDPIRKAISHSRQNNCVDHSNTSSNKIDGLAYSGNNLVPLILPPVHNRRNNQKKRKTEGFPRNAPRIKQPDHVLPSTQLNRLQFIMADGIAILSPEPAALNRGKTIDNQNLISWYKGRGP